MLRPKPSTDLCRLRREMVAVGHYVARKDALVNVLVIKGHLAAAKREEVWLGLWIDRYTELRDQVRAADDAAMTDYLEKLGRQIPYIPTDSLDQESVIRTPTKATAIADLLASMNAAEIRVPKVA